MCWLKKNKCEKRRGTVDARETVSTAEILQQAQREKRCVSKPRTEESDVKERGGYNQRVCVCVCERNRMSEGKGMKEGDETRGICLWNV